MAKFRKNDFENLLLYALMTKSQNISICDTLSLSPVQAQNGGVFISKGLGRHPARVIDSWEIILVRRGCLEISQGGENFSVKKHQVIILHPCIEHTGIADYAPELQFYWLHFTFTTEAPKNMPMLITPQRPARLEELFREFLDNQLSPSPCNVTSNCMVTMMLCELFKTADTKAQLNPSANNLARRAYNHIRLNIEKKLTPSDVADALECSVDHLSRIFKAFSGMNLSDAIKHEKISAAKENLCNTTLPIKIVAKHAGFNDVRHFRRVFQGLTGITPSQYRIGHTSLKINTK